MTDLFFSGRPDHEAEAKAICEGCDETARCLDRAIALQAQGVWGGTTEAERRRLVGENRSISVVNHRVP